MFRYFLTIFILPFVLFSSVTRFDSPATARTLDPSFIGRLEDEIEQKHQERIEEEGDYCVDLEKRYLNITADQCAECHEELDALGEKLRAENFERWPPGHCYGVSLFLIKYLIENPSILSQSCSHILTSVREDPDFFRLSHLFWNNQIRYYRISYSETEKVRRYFETLCGIVPEEWQELPSLASRPTFFSQAAVLSTLRRLEGKLVLLSYGLELGGGHTIVISAHPQKYFIFDPNQGIYQYPNLETLTRDLCIMLRDCQFRTYEAFKMGQLGLLLSRRDLS